MSTPVTNSKKAPMIVIAFGVLSVLAHLTLAITGVMTTAQWISGVVIGLAIAGVGNHFRLFGRR